MIAYIIDSLFFVDTPDSADCYSVLAAFSDETGVHSLPEIKANSALAEKIESLPIFAGYKYTYDVINDAAGKSAPSVFVEILVNECDAISLGQYPDLEIRRISRVNNDIVSGLKVFIANPETKDAGLAFFCSYTDAALQICPSTRNEVIYLGQDDRCPESAVVLGQRVHETLKTISDFWDDGTLKTCMAGKGLNLSAHLEDRAGSFSVKPVIPLADVKANPSLFHFIREEDKDAKTILGSYSYFTTCNLVSPENIEGINKLSSFVDIKKTTSTSDSAALHTCNACFADKVIITSEQNGTQFVVGLIHNGKCITMKDIVHLKSAYNLLRSILSDGTKFATAIFGSCDDKPTCKIMYVTNALVNEKIESGTLVVTDVTTLPAYEMRAKLLADYSEVSIQGIRTANLTELEAANSCLPENQGASTNAAAVLAALCNSFDDTYDTVEQFTLCDSIEESIGFNSQSAAYKQASDVLNGMNRTIVQNTCVSTFNRQLPKFTDLLLIFDEEYQNAVKTITTDSAESPDKTNVFEDSDEESIVDESEVVTSTDENDDAADSDDSDDVDDKALSYTDLDYLHIDLEYMRLDADTDVHKSAVGLGPYFDSKFYREIYNTFGPTVIASPECIEGNDANNKLAIQSNEILMYAGLYMLVIEGLCYENKFYTIEEVKKALSNGIHSVIVDKFIRLLTKDVFSLNWRHTGTVKETLSRMTNKRDIEFYNTAAERSSSETFMCLGWYNVIMSNGKRTVVFKDGEDDERFPAVVNYINSEIINSMSWVEAFIRLARWNTRKPKQLWIPSKKLNNNTEYFLNLLTFSKRDWGGVFDESKRILFDDAFFTIDGRLSCEASKASGLIQALTYFNEKLDSDAELVYGVPLCTRYADTEETRISYIDIFTLVNSIASGKLAVAGISFDNETQAFMSSPVSSDTLVMDPEEYYNNDAFVVPLISAINNSNAQQSAGFETMVSIHLTKLWGLAGMSQCLDIKYPGARIFDMLRLFEMTAVDGNILDRCSKVLTASPALRSDMINSINRDYGNSITPEMLASMIMFTNLALPYIKLAQEIQEFKKKNGTKPEIADVLNMAREVDLNRAVTKSSAETTAETPQSTIFRSYYNKCSQVYSLAIDNSILLYVGVINTVIQGKQQSSYVLWEPGDIPSIAALGCADKSSSAEPASFEFITNSVVLPYWSYCKTAYASKAKTEITDVERRNALATLKNLRQSRYISFRTGVTGSSQAVCDTFTKFVFDVWVGQVRKQNKR